MQASTFKPLLIATFVCLGVSLSACKKEESPSEKMSDSIKDGLDMRKNEPLKDAGEDLKDAAEDTGDAIKDKAKDAKDDASK